MTEVGADAGPLRSVGVEEKFLVLRRTSTVLVDALTAVAMFRGGSGHTDRMATKDGLDEERSRRRVGNGENRLPPVAAVLVAVAAYALLPTSLLFAPRYVIPAIEGVLLIALLATNPTHGGPAHVTARDRSCGGRPGRLTGRDRRVNPTLGADVRSARRSPAS